MTKSSHKNKADNEKTIYTRFFFKTSVFLAKCINAKPIAMHNDNSAMNILCWRHVVFTRCGPKCQVHRKVHDTW